MPLRASQREGSAPHRKQTSANPVPFGPESNEKTFTSVFQWLNCRKVKMPRLPGSLATAQKTHTVAEGYSRHGLWLRRVVVAEIGLAERHDHGSPMRDNVRRLMLAMAPTKTMEHSNPSAQGMVLEKFDNL